MKHTETMTMAQIRNICLTHNYILLRHYSTNSLYGFNCKCVDMGKNKLQPNEKETVWQSFIPCSFNQYLNFKVPFVSPMEQNAL